MLWSIDSCQNKVSADQYHLTVSRAQVSTHPGRTFFFLKLSPDKLLVCKWSPAQVNFFCNSYEICCLYVTLDQRYTQNAARIKHFLKLCISQFQLRLAPLPLPGWPPGFWIFFALDGKFPGVGTLELSNPPGWGRKKRANAPSSVNTTTFFIDRTVK